MGGKLLAVFCYDIVKDSVRARLAALLEEDAVRVQDSVFEGWMSEARVAVLASRAAALIGPDDSLRVYRLDGASARQVKAYGPTPAAEPGDYHLL